MVSGFKAAASYSHLSARNKIYKTFFSRSKPKSGSNWTKFGFEDPKFDEIKNKNPVILGISSYFHDSSACILKDGKIVAAADEERFTRVKHDTRFPVNAIKFCLDYADVSDVDLIVYFENPEEKLQRIKKTFVKNKPSYRNYKEIYKTWAEDKLPEKIRERVKDMNIRAPVYFLNHHLCHAASSYFTSPFKESAILTIDGVGELYTTTIGHADGDRIGLKKAIEFPDSVGLLYSLITAFLGFMVNNDEYKVMGLAPYGDRERYYNEMKSLIDIKNDGSFLLNIDPFNFETNQAPFEKLEKIFNIKKRKRESGITQEHKDIAAALQRVTEETVINILKILSEDTKSENICLSGGVALNSVMNGKILSHTNFKNIFIQPSAGDSGTVIGAVKYAYHSIVKDGKREHITHSYFGPEYSASEIRKYLEENNVKFKEFKTSEELIKTSVNLLKKKNVIALFQGRMEWGPRALGNRSILADSRYTDMQDVLNAKVKHREMFRPFAPVVCIDDASDYFECDKPIPEPTDFMLMVYPIKKDKQKKIPSVTHVDGSGRLQTIRREQNPFYFDLTKEFGKQTGVPILINTSFNIRGEPMVCNPHDAYLCMMGTGIDYLIMGKFLVKRADNPKDIWDSEKKVRLKTHAPPTEVYTLH